MFLPTPLLFLFVALLQPVGDSQVIMGIVTDADTGQPIKHFRVVPGGKWEPRIVLFHNQAQEFRDGHYIFSGFATDYGPIVRIEADGYAPVTSDVLDVTSDVEFDVELRKAPNIEARVTTPDGEPARNAVVLMGAEFTQITLKNEQLDEQALQLSPSAETDAEGRFVFWPVDEDFRVLVLHDSGWIDLSRDEMKLLDPIVLLPWARIEGVVRIGSEPARGQKVSFQWLHASSRGGRDYFLRQYDVETDENGRFAIDRVPGGKGRIGRYVQVSSSGRFTGYALTNSESFELKAGQTLHVEIGGKGRPVVGRFDFPEGVPPNWQVHARLSTKPAHVERTTVPEDIRAQGADQVRQWWEAYRQSDEYKAQQAAAERDRATRRYYAFPLAEDGAFRIDDVVPGQYELQLSATATTDDEPPRLLQPATAKAEVTVPEIPGGRSDEPLDVGQIAVQRKEKP